jgi:hypothetical protein
MLVAQIALLNLNSSSSDMCNGLILEMQGMKSFFRDSGLNVLEFAISSTFVTSACWADDLKDDNVLEFNNWHFINEVWTNGTDVPYPPLPADTVVSQIKRIKESLTSRYAIISLLWHASHLNSASSVWSKAMLLRFLVHLVGDIHQPLHCVTLYSKQFPQGDLGGNRFIVMFPNATSLHMVWDSGILITL